MRVVILKKNFLFFAVFLCVVAASTLAEAKDLSQRLGVGFKNNTSESMPSLAAVYYLSNSYAVTGGAGFDTKKHYSAMQVNAGLRKMIYLENNLNFYLGGQFGVVNFENPVDGKNNGLDLLAVFGSEFYFSGLESLGFTFEAGLGFSTAKDTRIRTVADDPFRAGIVFYF